MRVKHHKKICKQLNDTYARKNKDYGNSFDESIDDYGDIAFLVRASDKFKRMDQLITKGDRQVDDESLTDTVLDMANYCIMFAMYKENQSENNITQEPGIKYLERDGVIQEIENPTYDDLRYIFEEAE